MSKTLGLRIERSDARGGDGASARRREAHGLPETRPSPRDVSWRFSRVPPTRTSEQTLVSGDARRFASVVLARCTDGATESLERQTARNAPKCAENSFGWSARVGRGGACRP